MFRSVDRSVDLAKRPTRGTLAATAVVARGTRRRSVFFAALAGLVLAHAPAFGLDASDNALSHAQNATSSATKITTTKPKLDWGSVHVEFGAESITINRPQFEIAMPLSSDETSSVADPELIYAILRPAFRALEGIAVNKIEINDGVVNVLQGRVRTHQLSSLAATFNVSPAAGLTTGKGSFVLRGETLTFDTAFAKPDADSDDGRIPLRLTVSGAGLTASFEGVADNKTGARLEGKVDVTIEDLRKLVKWSGFSLSDGAGLNTLRTRGKMTWTSGLFAMSEGLFTLDGNKASGVLSLDLRNERASVEGTLALERLDLTGYFAKEKETDVAQATVLGTLVPALDTATQLQVPILRDFDADVRMSVNEIRAGTFRTGAGAMALTLRSGNLLADVAELKVFDGSVVGQLEFNANKPSVAISARGLLDNVEAGEAMRWIATVPAIRGRARMTVNLASQGATLSDLMRSMKGDARLTMLDGGAFQIDVDGLMKKAEHKPLLGWDVANNQETRFGTLEAKLLLDNARISTRGLRADRDDTRIVAYGTINLAEQHVSVRMSVVKRPDDPNSAAETSSSANSSGPTLTMQGPWDEPSISVEKQAQSALPRVIKIGDTVIATSSVD